MSEHFKDAANGTDDRRIWETLGLIDASEGAVGPVNDDARGNDDARATLLDQLHAQVRSSVRSESVNQSGRQMLGRRSIVTVALVSIAISLGWGMQAIAARKNRQAKVAFSNQVLSFALDLYEEDADKLASKALLAEASLPSEGILRFDEASQRQMLACSDAVAALAAIRNGLPEIGLRKLDDTIALLENQTGTEWSVPELQLTFNIVAGRACIEAADMLGRGLGSEIRSSLRRKSYSALQDALAALESSDVGRRIPQRDVLISAILVDLARQSIKRSPMVLIGDAPEAVLAFQDRRLETVAFLDAAQQTLVSVDFQSERWWVQRVRLFNNRLLLQCRTATAILTSKQEVESVLAEYEAEILSMASSISLDLDGQPRLSHALPFEIGVCYSNLADLIECYIDAGSIHLSSDLSRAQLRFRNNAIEHLSAVPHIARSQRHVENLLANYTRRLRAKVESALMEGKLDEMRPDLHSEALVIDALLSGVFDQEIAQLNLGELIVVAWLLPERYELADLRERSTLSRDRITVAHRQLIQELFALPRNG